jgi:deoxyribodipyrimidine photo-lyase
MWVASIWIFTLKLPWALGADFFQQHLLDGDPASNTLSWRWVAGLHTHGKTYLARPDNITEYTVGRFRPGRDELAAFAAPLGDVVPLERVPLRPADNMPKSGRVILLVTGEDLSPEAWPLGDVDVRGVAVFAADHEDARLSPLVRAFKTAAMTDVEIRAAAHWGQPVVAVATAADLLTFAANQGAVACVTSLVPVGLVRPEIDAWTTSCQAAGVPLLQIVRRWDSLFWPHATAGFFKLKERIPGTLAKLGLATTERPS